MHLAIRFAALAITLSLALLACASQPAAPAYPQKSIDAVVGYAPGGPIDAIARTMTEAIKPHLSQPLVVVNRAGASGTVGAAEVIGAKADGYTIGVTSHPSLVFEPNNIDLPYKTPDDYRPIINLVTAPFILSSPANMPWKTLKEAIAWGKANPGKLRVGLSGAGIIGELVLAELGGGAFVPISFDSAAPSITAALGGHIEMTISITAPALPHLKAGTLKLVSVMGEKRNPLFPDVQTAREEGIDVVHGNYYLVYAPKGVSDQVAQTLHDSFKKAMDSDIFKKFAEDNTFNLDYKNSADLKTQLQKDYTFFAERMKTRKN